MLGPDALLYWLSRLLQLRLGRPLTLVDCAGTERKEDSATHSAERRKEGAEINTSLHALKECLRHWLLAREGNKARRPSAEAQHTSPTLATTPDPNPGHNLGTKPGPGP